VWRGVEMTRTVRAVLLMGVLVVAAIVAAVVVTRGDAVTGSADAASDSPTTGGSPTSEEPADGPATSVPSAGPTGPVATDPPAEVTGGNVTPVLGYVDYDAAGRRVEASGFIAGVVESGGTCTLTLVKGPTQVTATTHSEADATTSNCGSLTVPRDKLAPGTWQASLSYASAGSKGTSQPVTVEVPA
jgi:hypothetical protein